MEEQRGSGAGSGGLLLCAAPWAQPPSELRGVLVHPAQPLRAPTPMGAPKGSLLSWGLQPDPLHCALHDDDNDDGDRAFLNL